MKITVEDLPVKILQLFIILSPLEHIARVEHIAYAILIGILILLFLKKMKLKCGLKLVLVCFSIYLLICCMWSPADVTIVLSSALVKTVVFLFLILVLQFDYSEKDYSKIKKAFLFQGIFLVGICILFGDFQDGRLWISTASSDADPNYLSAWFIFPQVYCCDALIGDKISRKWKIAIVGEMVAMYTCVFLTASRSGFATNVLVVLLYLMYCFRETIKSRPIRAVGLLIVIVLVCLCGMKLMPEYLLKRLTTTHSMGSRGKIWKELFQAMNDDWIKAVIGFGDGATVFHNTQGEIYGLRGLVAHNTFIDVMFNNGMIGLGGFLVVIIGGLIEKINCRRFEIVIASLGMCLAIFTLTALTTRPVSFMLLLLLIDIKSSKIQIG